MNLTYKSSPRLELARESCCISRKTLPISSSFLDAVRHSSAHLTSNHDSVGRATTLPALRNMVQFGRTPDFLWILRKVSDIHTKPSAYLKAKGAGLRAQHPPAALEDRTAVAEGESPGQDILAAHEDTQPLRRTASGEVSSLKGWMRTDANQPSRPGE